jgi:predicted nucleic acid-binding protein
MSGRKRIVYDTRFIAAVYYPSSDDEASRIRKELTTNLSRYVSSVTVYEIYKLTLESEGRETADLRIELLRRDFGITNLDWKIAKQAALLWKKYRIPMADAVIAATALHLKAICVTNDPHFAKIKEIRSQWV